jgi:hypothetical protein
MVRSLIVRHDYLFFVLIGPLQRFDVQMGSSNTSYPVANGTLSINVTVSSLKLGEKRKVVIRAVSIINEVLEIDTALVGMISTSAEVDQLVSVPAANQFTDIPVAVQFPNLSQSCNDVIQVAAQVSATNFAYQTANGSTFTAIFLQSGTRNVTVMYTNDLGTFYSYKQVCLLLKELLLLYIMTG